MGRRVCVCVRTDGFDLLCSCLMARLSSSLCAIRSALVFLLTHHSAAQQNSPAPKDINYTAIAPPCVCVPVPRVLAIFVLFEWVVSQADRALPGLSHGLELDAPGVKRLFTKVTRYQLAPYVSHTHTNQMRSMQPSCAYLPPSLRRTYLSGTCGSRCF